MYYVLRLSTVLSCELVEAHTVFKHFLHHLEFFIYKIHDRIKQLHKHLNHLRTFDHIQKEPT
ncbi:unnamed protein product [Tenebrio molitor]|nr:unnamed protein product [Tenebrio molitor]